MPDLTQLERSLRILQRLSTHHDVTVQELCDLFDRTESIRTVQRTLDSIQASHIPLSYKTGAHGVRYYSLHRAFDYVPLNLSPDELLAALLLAQFGDLFEGTRIGRDISGVIEKLDQLVPPGSIALTSTLRGVVDAFQMRQPGMVEIEAKDTVIRDVFKVIIEKRVVWVQYCRPGDETPSRFNLHPYSLLFHSGAIYAIGYQPYYKNWIYLALHRIREIEATDETFVRDFEFRLDAFLKDNFGVWQQEPVDVVIRFDATVTNSIRERRWHPSQQMTDLEDGGIELKMHVGPSYELIAWILRWGAFAEVMEPGGLRGEVQELLQQALNRYRN